MLEVIASDQRGQVSFGWLNSKHSFSFGSYYNSDYMGYRKLRVLNDDIVQPGAGFDWHSHQHMDILTYVVEGVIEHQDSEGHKSVIEAGEFQLMSAGTGISHREYNASNTEALRFLQIWLRPSKKIIAPQHYHITQQTPLIASGYDNDLSNEGHNRLPLVSHTRVFHQSQSIKLNLEYFAFDANKYYYMHNVTGAFEYQGASYEEGSALYGSGKDWLETRTIPSEPSDNTFLLFEMQ